MSVSRMTELHHRAVVAGDTDTASFLLDILTSKAIGNVQLPRNTTQTSRCNQMQKQPAFFVCLVSVLHPPIVIHGSPCARACVCVCFAESEEEEEAFLYLASPRVDPPSIVVRHSANQCCTNNNKPLLHHHHPP